MSASTGRDHHAPSLLSPGILIPFAIVTLIWGSTWLVIRDQVSAVPPSWSVAYRFLLASVGMFVLARIRRLPLWIGGRGIAFAAGLGATQFMLNFNFVYRAELVLTSGVVAVFYALLLIPNSLFAWIAFRQPVSRNFILGSVVAVSGVTLLFLREYRYADVAPGAVLTGIGLSLCGLLAASVSNVMQGSPIARRLPIISLLAWAMLLGGVMDAALAWITSGSPVLDSRPAYVAGVVYLAIAGSVCTFPLYFRLIQQIGAGRAAYSGVLVPVIAMLLSTLFESYRWSTLAAAGAALSIAGMVIAMRAKPSR
ncbi:EamA family transporter [Sphingobium sp. SCG-1]|uniref:DMT family transporter n=1 Tax=Sphingobium sp. SCG-1 TaxID=2072936 RepID=UPI000CD68043|nr:EamA family transporter [Sphingobium sp. SCG-1]AUW56789.1 EamA family transporter [Sphingobium sp. SCG-1]